MKFTGKLKRVLEDGQSIEAWLHPHQMRGVLWALTRRGVLLRWPTGAGKTAAAAVLVTRPTLSGHTVIVCRSDAKVTVWKRTLDRLTTCDTHIVWGTSGTIPDDTDVVILNWEVLKQWKTPLIKWLKGGSVILDEAHYGKAWRRTKKVMDPFTKRPARIPLDTRAVAMHELGRQAEYIVALTATPVAENRMDFWNILDTLQPKQWGNSWSYAHRYCAAHDSEYGGLDTSGASNSEEFKRRLAGIMHSVDKADILDVYNVMKRETIRLDERELGRAGAFASLLKQTKSKEDHVWVKLARASSRKHKWALSRAQWHAEENDRTVWGLGLQREVEALGEKFVKKFGADRVRWSHGGTSVREREDQLRWYTTDDGGPKFLVVSIQAWGQSIDGLQCSNAAYTLQLPWRPIDVIQWDGRFQRGGGGTDCTVYYVIAPGTYDERVQELILAKIDVVLETYSDRDAGAIADTLDQPDEELLNDIIASF